MSIFILIHIVVQDQVDDYSEITVHKQIRSNRPRRIVFDFYYYTQTVCFFYLKI